MRWTYLSVSVWCADSTLCRRTICDLNSIFASFFSSLIIMIFFSASKRNGLVERERERREMEKTACALNELRLRTPNTNRQGRCEFVRQHYIKIRNLFWLLIATFSVGSECHCRCRCISNVPKVQQRRNEINKPFELISHTSTRRFDFVWTFSRDVFELIRLRASLPSFDCNFYWPLSDGKWERKN